MDVHGKLSENRRHHRLIRTRELCFKARVILIGNLYSPTSNKMVFKHLKQEGRERLRSTGIDLSKILWETKIMGETKILGKPKYWGKIYRRFSIIRGSCPSCPQVYAYAEKLMAQVLALLVIEGEDTRQPRQQLDGTVRYIF